MMAVVFAICVCILATGFVWFHVARPILEDYGVIKTVNDNDNAPALLMSRSEHYAAPSSAPSLQTANVQTPDQTTDPTARRQKLLDTYRPLRKLGMSRDDARMFLNGLGVPLDNNLWADAAPEEPPHITPVAGRATNAQFDHEYRPLEV